jgi:hypothetical protein
MVPGKTNAVFSKIVSTMPTKEGPPVLADRAIDQNGLLPARKNFYRYEGSLTTPPCSEGVTWFVLKSPLKIAGGALTLSDVTFTYDGETKALERFDLSQLIVMGIIWGVDEPRALVRDPTGKGYIVRTGTPIGKNKGRILRIEDNKVVVKETYLDHLDRATTKEVELELYSNGDGRKG